MPSDRQVLPDDQPPVTPEATIEIFAFMEAADESKRQGGTPVDIASVLEKGRREAAAKLEAIAAQAK